jgi:LysR family transcriptional regulator, nitrogen assimilation regulatory protein
MELRQMRYFKAIADARSFLRAADQLHVAQPALSRSIANLEEELGCSLFVRHSAGVSLTDPGSRFYAHAAGVLAKVREAMDDMATEDPELRGVVSLGAPQVLHSKLVVAAGIEFLAQHPLCELNLVQDSGTRLREKLNEGAIDLAIIADPVGERLYSRKLVRESICIICKPEDRALFPATATAKHLEDLPLILTGYPGSLRLLIEKRFPRERSHLRIRSEVNSSALLVDLVTHGAGYGVAPCSAIGLLPREALAYVPIEDFHVSWAIATTFERRKMRPVKVLEDLLVAKIERLVSNDDWPTASLV